jgi:TIGR00268 family protein
MMITKIKYEKLCSYLKELGSVAVAFSSGVDSTFLLKVAHDVLGENVVAVTARSCSFPERELIEAIEYTKQNSIKHLIIDSEELEIEGFSQNPTNRCYLCKHELFTKLKAVALENGVLEVVEGSNMDDMGDYRPGHLAIEELGIKSPLRYAELTKAEIRQLSRELGLGTWEKQSFACLSSRFPYGESITREKLKMVDAAEQYLIDFGWKQVRVRHHGEVARIEVPESEFSALIDSEIRYDVYEKMKQLGFTYVALDLKGYRTGSMNETLSLL